MLPCLNYLLSMKVEVHPNEEFSKTDIHSLILSNRSYFYSQSVAGEIFGKVVRSMNDFCGFGWFRRCSWRVWFW